MVCEICDERKVKTFTWCPEEHRYQKLCWECTICLFAQYYEWEDDDVEDYIKWIKSKK